MNANIPELQSLSYDVRSEQGHAFTVWQGERVVGYRDSEAEGWELAQEDADSDENFAGPCPACGSEETHRGHGDACGIETFYKRCEKCGHDWDQA